MQSGDFAPNTQCNAQCMSESGAIQLALVKHIKMQYRQLSLHWSQASCPPASVHNIKLHRLTLISSPICTAFSSEAVQCTGQLV